jgi:D-alanine-D-alanine ligase
MDKAVTKEFFKARGVSTPKSVLIVNNGKDVPSQVESAAEKIGFPCVAKACNGGSSVGVYIVENEEELKKAVDSAFYYDRKVLVEEFIKGRELTCGVMERKALPVVEIAPVAGFYDYRNKYQAGSTVETCPAQIGEDNTKRVQNLAEKAYRALGLRTYARIDIILKENGDAYCLEANSLPGMTPTSLLPQEAAVTGLDYIHLCEKIIALSLEKYQ